MSGVQIKNLAFACPRVYTEARFHSLNSSAGTWVFDHRRWLNPNTSAELQQLRQVKLTFRYTTAAPVIATQPNKPYMHRPTVSCRSASLASSSATSPPSFTPWVESRSVPRPLCRDAGLATRGKLTRPGACRYRPEALAAPQTRFSQNERPIAALPSQYSPKRLCCMESVPSSVRISACKP